MPNKLPNLVSNHWKNEPDSSSTAKVILLSTWSDQSWPGYTVCSWYRWRARLRAAGRLCVSRGLTLRLDNHGHQPHSGRIAQVFGQFLSQVHLERCLGRTEVDANEATRRRQGCWSTGLAEGSVFTIGKSALMNLKTRHKLIRSLAFGHHIPFRFRSAFDESSQKTGGNFRSPLPQLMKARWRKFPLSALRFRVGWKALYFVKKMFRKW